MLPQPYCQYQNFQNLLYQLQNQLQLLAQNPAQIQVEQGDRAQLQTQLQEAFAAAQTYFQQQILSVNPEALAPDEATRIHSFQVEINKQLRLLSTDLMFLRTARLATTQSQRRQQMGDRLTLLLRYCEGILEEK